LYKPVLFNRYADPGEFASCSKRQKEAQKYQYTIRFKHYFELEVLYSLDYIFYKIMPL